MPELIYLLCTVTSLICAWLLLRSYRRSGFPLLFWSGLCFSALALNNMILVLDKLVFPDVNFSIWRLSSALVALLLLLYGLIWQDD